MSYAVSDALKTRTMIVGMLTFAVGLVFVAVLPPAVPEVSRGGAIFATE